MKEFICEYCGKKAISTKHGGKDQKYCSKECREKAVLQRGGWGGERCPHNPEVLCTVPDCDKCGWNPEVEKKRKEALEV